MAKTDAQLRREIESVFTSVNGSPMRQNLHTVLNGIVDRLGASGSSSSSGSVSSVDLSSLRNAITALDKKLSSLFEKVSIGVTEKQEPVLNEDGTPKLEEDGLTPVYNTIREERFAIKAKFNLFSVGFVSAYGDSEETSPTGYDRLDSWDQYNASTAGYVLSAALGWELHNMTHKPTKQDVIDALGYTPMSSLTSKDITNALGYTPLSKDSLSSKYLRDLLGNIYWANVPVTFDKGVTDSAPTFGSVTIGGAKITWDATNGCLIVDKGFVSESFVSAFGIGKSTGSGVELSPTTWTSSSDFTTSVALSANLGWDLNTRIQTMNSHITNKSNPHNVTASQVGLGNVENTALSTWKGSSKLTTCSQGTFGSVVTHAHSDYVTGLSFSSNQLQWSKGGSAQSGITIGYATSAGTADKLSTVSKTAWGRTYWTSGGVPTSISGDLGNVGYIYFGEETSSTPKIWYDSTNKCLRTNVGIVSESFVSAYGVNTEKDVAISGNLRLKKDSDNYGTKLNFGDSDYVYLYEDTDDHLKIYADNGLWIGNKNSAIKVENSDSSTASSTGDKDAVVTITSRLHIGTDWRGDQAYWKFYVDGRGYFNGNISVNGTVSVQGTVVHTSDMQLKNRHEDVDLSVNSIAEAPCFEFDYKNDVLGATYIGSSAQYWKEILPTAVKESEQGWLTLDYNAVVFASVVAIAKRSETHEERISRLEKENEDLRNKIVELENKE